MSMASDGVVAADLEDAVAQLLDGRRSRRLRCRAAAAAGAAPARRHAPGAAEA